MKKTVTDTSKLAAVGSDMAAVTSRSVKVFDLVSNVEEVMFQLGFESNQMETGGDSIPCSRKACAKAPYQGKKQGQEES